jgi:hypothetical protein
LSEGKGEETGEGLGGFVGRASRERERSRNGRGVTGGINGGNARVDGERREMTWGPTRQRKKKGEGRATVREGLMGCDVSVLGWSGSRVGPVTALLFFFVLFFFFFCFPFLP